MVSFVDSEQQISPTLALTFFEPPTITSLRAVDWLPCLVQGPDLQVHEDTARDMKKTEEALNIAILTVGVVGEIHHDKRTAAPHIRIVNQGEKTTGLAEKTEETETGREMMDTDQDDKKMEKGSAPALVLLHHPLKLSRISATLDY